MNLVINIDATDKSEAAVVSVADRTPVDELDELILGNQEPLTIAFCDDAGAVPAWVTDPAVLIVVGLGLPDLHAGKLYSATDDFAIVGSARAGVLNLDTVALRDALAFVCKNPAADAGRWLTLEVAKLDADGKSETMALLHVMVLWRVLETPANNTTFRYPAVLYDAQTGLLFRPDSIPRLSGGVPRGGAVNQVLTKIGPDDFDYDWRDGGTGSGSVTSVGLSMPDIFNVTGSPVTGAGTLAAALANQAANRVFAGPASGGAAAPTFRALAAADIPDLSGAYLTPASAAATYLTQADAANTYLTIASAIANFQPLAGILTALTALSDSAGWLHNDGAGALAWSTPTKSDVGLGNVENTALSTWAGSTNLITLGTIGTGAWQATAIGTAYGGMKTGGSTGQVLAKASNTDFDLVWATPLAGTVTSVTLTMPDIFTVGGSPITSSGTFAVALEAQSANVVFAGPSSGGTGVPAFRALVAADIPSLSATYQPLDGDLTAIAGLSGTGLAVRTAGSTWALRSITGTSARVSVTNGDGVSGNPTINIASNYVGQNTITTLGTIGTGTWQGAAIAADYGGTGQSSYTVGDLLYASTTTALSKRAAVATGSVLASAGVGTAPVWSTSPQLAALGLGVAAAAGPLLRITNNAGGLPTVYSTTQVLVHVGNTDAATPAILIDGSGGGGLLELRRANGTLASPTQLTTGTIIGTIGWRGYATTTTFTNRRAEISGVATEDWTSTANGSKIVFNVTAATTTTTAEAMAIFSTRLQADFSNGTVSNRFAFQSSTTNGFTAISAIPNGTGNLTAFTAFNSSDMANTSVAQLVMSSTEAYVNSGFLGTGTLRPLILKMDGTAVMTIATGGTTSFANATDATSTTAASLTLAGGLGVAKKSYFGAAMNIAASATTFDSAVLFGLSANSGTIIAGSSSTIMHLVGADSTISRITFDAFGAQPVIQGRRANGTNASKTNVLNGQQLFTLGAFGYRATAYSTGGGGAAFWTAAEDWTDTAIGTNFTIIACPIGSTSQTTAFQFFNSGLFTTPTLSVSATTASSSITTGAGVIAGGLGVGGALYVGNAIFSVFGGITTAIANDGSNGYLGTQSNHACGIFTNNTIRVTVSTAGAVRFNNYGAGTLVTDSSGNITASSDRELKIIRGPFVRGLDAVRALAPVLYLWNEKSGMEMRNLYAGFIAQDVQEVIPEAVSVGRNGLLGLQDRPILAATVNAIKELADRVDALEKVAAA